MVMRSFTFILVPKTIYAVYRDCRRLKMLASIALAPSNSIPVGAMKSIPNKNLSKATMMIMATMTIIIVHKVPSIFLLFGVQHHILGLGHNNQ
jgi:hypothetical protein